MKRLPGEDFHEYKERRKGENKVRRWFGRTFNFIVIPLKPKPKKVVYEPSNPTIGKRHKNESLKVFRERRMACNVKRRQKEKAQRIKLNETSYCKGA